MPNFSRTNLKTKLEARLGGDITDADMNTIINDSVLDVISDIDLKSTIRRTALSPNLVDDQYEYSAPSDLKGNKVIDLRPQVQRGRYDNWRLTTPSEFDRIKKSVRIDNAGDPIDISNGEDWMGDSILTVDRRDFINKIRVSKPIDSEDVTIDALDSVGDWVAYGDGDNLTNDSDNYVKGSSSINWDIDNSGGTTAGIYNDSLNTFDISDYKTNGYVFVWVYISDSSDITNFILRIGSSASDYYSITETTNNEGNSFHTGWNLLRFDFDSKSTTGTPDDDACDYIAIYMTKDAGKTSETDYRFDHIVIATGKHYWVYYYSKYGWQDTSGTYLEESTSDNDLLNADTEELRIFTQKMLQLGEENLRNFDNADRHQSKYEIMIKKYKLENLSQALLQSQIYYNF